MKNKHKILTTLLIVLLCVVMLASLIACDNKNKGEQEEVKDTSEFITNGNFEVTTSDIFPKVPSGWSSSAGSTASGNETAVDEDALVAGVIDTTEKVYDKEKKAWNKLKNPGAVGNDSNILMIYNKKANSYKYTSNSFSLDAEKFFQIDISVKTENMTDNSYGAYVKIGGDAFIEFENIKTNGAWTTYSAIVKTSNVSSNSLNVLLSNGKGGQNDGNLSEGYAFFDNIVVKETTEQEYNNYKNAQDSGYKKVSDLVLGDNSFINISGDKSPYTARKWTGVTSNGSDGVSAPTGSDYMEKGIIDFNAKLPASVSDDIVKPASSEKKVLMINNKKATAYGYRSDSKIRIPASASDHYKLSVLVQTKDIVGKGAYIKLKSTTDKDEQIVILDNINNEGGWAQVSILIKPDTNRNKDIYIEVGLGTGGKNDTEELVSGQAFFDEVTLEKISEDDYNNAVEAEGEIAKASLVTEISEDLIPAGAAYNTDNYVEGNYATKNDGLNERGEKIKYVDDKTGITYLQIKNNNPTVTRYKFNEKFLIESNNHYRLSMNVKTDIADDKKGISILLYEVVEKNFENQGKDKELVKIEKFNSDTVKKNVLADGSVELTFLVQGDALKDKEIYFEVVVGAGTNLTPATLIKGSAYLSYIELNKINFADYNSESGTYVKKHSFRADNGTIKNNDFNIADISSTKKQLDKVAGDDTNAKFDEEDFLSENSKGVFGLPLNWTTSTKDQLKGDFKAGIYNINNNAQTTALGIADAGIPAEIQKDNNNLLAISALATGNEQKPWGFTSPSLSLSKGKFYELTVWARLVRGKATINLKSSSKSVVSSFEIENESDELQKYTFYISAGFDDFTAYLELKLGDNSDATLVGTALFDMPELNEIPEDHYEFIEKEIVANAPADKKLIAFTTTTFDNSTPSEDNEALDSPNGWEGSHADSDAPSGKNKSVAGVYNRNHGNRNWFGGADGANKEPIPADVLENILNSAPRLVTNETGEIVVDSTADHNNDNVLVINNNEASEYVYSTTLATNSLVEEKYYEISLFVLTYDVAADKHATISLKLHNSTFEFAKNDKRGINVNTNGEWKKYSFFIQTEKGVTIDSVKLSVALGLKDKENYVSGYLFVDNVSIDEITEDRFKAQVPADKFPNEEVTEDKFTFDKVISASNHRIVFTEEDMQKEPEEETEEEKETDPLLWLYITSGVIGGLIVIVVIIFLLQKFHVFDKLKSRKSNFNEKGKETYNRNNVNANKTSSTNKDINKKHQD